MSILTRIAKVDFLLNSPYSDISGFVSNDSGNMIRNPAANANFSAHGPGSVWNFRWRERQSIKLDRRSGANWGQLNNRKLNEPSAMRQVQFDWFLTQCEYDARGVFVLSVTLVLRRLDSSWLVCSVRLHVYIATAINIIFLAVTVRAHCLLHEKTSLLQQLYPS